VFFVDEKGNPATKTHAGDYATIGDFNYDYQPGSCEEVVLPAVAIAAVPAVAEVQRFSAQIVNPSLSATQAAGGAVAVPPALLQAGAEPGVPKLFAKITVAFPPLGHPIDRADQCSSWRYRYRPVEPLFRGHARHVRDSHIARAGHVHSSMSGPVNALRSSNQLAMSQPLDIRVVPSAMPHAAMARAAAAKAEVVSIVVEAH